MHVPIGGIILTSTKLSLNHKLPNACKVNNNVQQLIIKKQNKISTRNNRYIVYLLLPLAHSNPQFNRKNSPQSKSIIIDQ